LRLADEASKMLRGDIPLQNTIPIAALNIRLVLQSVRCRGGGFIQRAQQALFFRRDQPGLAMELSHICKTFPSSPGSWATDLEFQPMCS